MLIPGGTLWKEPEHSFWNPWYLRTMALLPSRRTLSLSDTARTIGTDWFVTVCKMEQIWQKKNVCRLDEWGIPHSSARKLYDEWRTSADPRRQLKCWHCKNSFSLIKPFKGWAQPSPSTWKRIQQHLTSIEQEKRSACTWTHWRSTSVISTAANFSDSSLAASNCSGAICIIRVAWLKIFILL